MTRQTPSDRPDPLSDADAAALRCVAGHMIPADPGAGLPGADEPRIFADMLGSIERDRAALVAALHALARGVDGDLAAMPRAARAAALADFRTQHPRQARALETTIALAYYRDPQVMTAIGLEPRPPFPQGYEVEQGDWSLLEPVRARGKIYRMADKGEDRT